MFLVQHRPLKSTLFPYTTLFRSVFARSPSLGCRGPGRASLNSPTASSARTSTQLALDRKSTRLNSSHVERSYAVFCLKKKILIRHRNLQNDENRRVTRKHS